MSSLSSNQVLEESREADFPSITSLHLSHRALSDVSCLVDFPNLTKLDLRGNNLSSLQGLRSCANLTWLSVVENKLDNLKGVEGLLKLKVLNAGRNRLVSICEVNLLINLQALILNDNKISSINGLEKLRQLNTLVASRNPICDIGDSLRRIKPLSKLSLSKCQVKVIGCSLKYCSELKELRLAHNEITALPAELARNSKIEIIDLGDNLITKWSDIEVLSSLSSLKNLNLLGNPISEQGRLVKKIKKLVPSLQILNAKPMETELKRSRRHHKTDTQAATGLVREEPIANKKVPFSGIHEHHACADPMLPEKQVELTDAKIEKEPKPGKEGKKNKQKDLAPNKSAGIDDSEIPFVDLILSENVGNLQESGQKRKNRETSKDAKSISGLISISYSKNKSAKSSISGLSAVQSLLITSEIGTGGSSTWGD